MWVMINDEVRIQVLDDHKETVGEYKYANFATETASKIQVSDCNGNCRVEYK